MTFPLSPLALFEGYETKENRMTTTEATMREYPKIYGPFKRHTEGPDKNKLIDGEWTSPTFEYLQDTTWLFTEKVDGTNIRVHWDGHKVTFGGRTDRAQIPAKLIEVLVGMFPEELFEQTFGEQTATLYGEGYGSGIQKGGVYRADMSFVLFDVLVGDWWLLRDGVEDVAAKVGVDVVPIVLEGTLHDAITRVRGGLDSAWGAFTAEGLVGVPKAGLLDRSGKRITVKVKARDFEGGA
jgi:hypothetical protein